MKPFLVCDFDGTVCLEDVGDRFFEHFVPRERRPEWAGLIADYDSGRIGSRECLDRECEMVRLTRDEAVAFADGFQVEPSFPGLVEWARASGIGIAVVSDGLDVYIRRILGNAGLSDVRVETNLAHFEGGGRLRPSFPWQGLGCGRCANCKGHHVRERQRDHSPVVMIGDAHSDVCGALAADRVFARATLRRLLAERGVRCEPFDTFDQVRDGLALDETPAE